MKSIPTLALLFVVTTTTRPLLTKSFTILPSCPRPRHSLTPLNAKVGIFSSTSTGHTEKISTYIVNAMEQYDDQEITHQDIRDTTSQELMDQDSIIVGAPTWNTDAQNKRSGTDWDEWLYDTLPQLDLRGKKVAVFGLGDQESYSDYYCDAAGELYDLFVDKGATMYGFTSTEGYTYHSSKAERNDKFVGAMFDEDNQYEESEGRAKAWVEQLKSEGFMEE
jgi:flavodoxin I